ncbi:helix-turn-helix transcriptional regulator [Palleronia sp. KMU-117]|uniref:helix-turn-helix transcriptional regulator n=1 Tax=Palleronia sp. KMU-117 TaxID=3434108 RepID=UPI003D723621
MTPDAKTPIALVVLIAVQIFCAAFFVVDLFADYREAQLAPSDEFQLHLPIEAIATLALLGAAAVETTYLRRLLRRKADLERSLEMARGAVTDVIESHFDVWGLSPSERDVAMFLVKGLNTTEIAEMRGSAEGTVKAHLNAIYRKSGTRSRSDMLSVLIDSLMAGGRAGL